jgi:hypothetical protein
VLRPRVPAGLNDIIECFSRRPTILKGLECPVTKNCQY